MKTLSELSLDHAFASPETLRAALDYAERFTARHAATAHLAPGAREGELLSVQFPELLLPPEAGDLFVGRIRYGLVGFSPEPVGLGYYCAASRLRAWLDSASGTSSDRERVSSLLAYWQGRTTAEEVRAAYPPALAAALPSDDWTTESGVAFPLYRMAGSVLDYARLLELGLDGLDSETRRHLVASPADDPHAADFQLASLTATEVLRDSILHYLKLAPDAAMADSLRAILHRPPETFRQAVQLFWLYALHAGTWNYGRLDVALGPFLARDLDSGVLTEDEALALVCSLWRLMHAYANQYNNRVIVGGLGRPDEAAADRFALLAIAATRRLRLNQPQLSLRFHPAQDPLLWERAIDAIGEGCTFPVLYNDAVNVPAVASAFNVPASVATGYTPYGCGEYVLGPGSQGTPNGIINLLKALEVALHGGVDPVNGRRYASLPAAGAFTSFEALWAAYKSVVEPQVAALAEQEKLGYDISARTAPFLFISRLTPDCSARGRGALEGGSRLLGGTLETYGNTNAADSLHVIDELVFRRRACTLTELVAALDADFVGHERLRAVCRAVSKYGNDEATADAMARRVHEHICTVTRAQAARVGLDSYLVVIINNWANTLLGWKTSASADGRRAGEPMACANNPSPGADLAGPTAFLNSLLHLDPALHAGAVQNMKFSREWFQPSNRPRFEALLRAYFEGGGTQAMITVLSRDDLESALREPEKWGHLLVRVGGFSIRFVELPPDAQREILARTLH